jgi:hypothetical protein
MKALKFTILFVSFLFSLFCSYAQNASLNILTLNSGIVTVGNTVFLQVDVTNTDPTGTIAQNKLRPQISVPSGICVIQATGHTLPPGWTITSNSGSVIRITNTTDPIPPNTTRTSLIAIQGTTVGSGSIIGNLTFVGAAPAGDIGADNSSSSSISVTPAVPVTLSEFSASLVNCQPVLNWTTVSEINSDRFEIEKSFAGLTDWNKIATVVANGNASLTIKYSYTDNSINNNSKTALYRLKMIDKDGRYKYSEIIPVSLNCNLVKIAVFPNPVVNGKLYAGVTGTKGRLDAALLTLSGQVVLRQVIANGTNVINVSGIASGIYILDITDSAGISKKTKVTVQH